MATPPQPFPRKATRSAGSGDHSGPPQWRRRLLIGLGLGAAALLAFYWHPIMATARTGAAYGARVGCSCRFVAGRPLGECRKDFEPGMGVVLLSEDVQARRVTARFAFLASESASYRPGWGCQLDRWDD